MIKIYLQNESLKVQICKEDIFLHYFLCVNGKLRSLIICKGKGKYAGFR